MIDGGILRLSATAHLSNPNGAVAPPRPSGSSRYWDRDLVRAINVNEEVKISWNGVLFLVWPWLVPEVADVLDIPEV